MTAKIREPKAAVPMWYLIARFDEEKIYDVVKKKKKTEVQT